MHKIYVISLSSVFLTLSCHFLLIQGYNYSVFCKPILGIDSLRCLISPTYKRNDAKAHKTFYRSPQP